MMKLKLKYLFTALIPWLMMFNIEEYVVAILCLLLQLTFVGWPIASVWACKTLTKHLKKHEKTNAQQ